MIHSHQQIRVPQFRAILIWALTSKGYLRLAGVLVAPRAEVFVLKLSDIAKLFVCYFEVLSIFMLKPRWTNLVLCLQIFKYRNECIKIDSSNVNTLSCGKCSLVT